MEKTFISEVFKDKTPLVDDELVTVYEVPPKPAVTEVKPKMVMTVFACLMARDYIPNMDSKPDQ